MASKRKKRLTPGKFISQNKLPKENPSLKEIEEGQEERDVRLMGHSTSHYWDWMEQHDQQTEVS